MVRGFGIAAISATRCLRSLAMCEGENPWGAVRVVTTLLPLIPSCFGTQIRSAVADPVWALYAHVIDRIGPTPTLIEWDSDLPEWEGRAAEALRAQRMMDRLSERAEARREARADAHAAP